MALLVRQRRAGGGNDSRRIFGHAWHLSQASSYSVRRSSAAAATLVFQGPNYNESYDKLRHKFDVWQTYVDTIYKESVSLELTSYGCYNWQLTSTAEACSGTFLGAIDFCHVSRLIKGRVIIIIIIIIIIIFIIIIILVTNLGINLMNLWWFCENHSILFFFATMRLDEKKKTIQVRRDGAHPFDLWAGWVSQCPNARVCQSKKRASNNADPTFPRFTPPRCLSLRFQHTRVCALVSVFVHHELVTITNPHTWC